MIPTPRLNLRNCDPDIYAALLNSDEALSSLLQVQVPANWSEFGLAPYAWAFDQLKKDPEQQGWLTYLTIHREDQVLVGTCGYKGKPDANGWVEIGYSIVPEYRQQGLATEVARALIAHAFKNAGVKVVQAHTLATENASTKILKKCGLQFVKEMEDPEDGKIWQWQISKV